MRQLKPTLKPTWFAKKPSLVKTLPRSRYGPTFRIKADPPKQPAPEQPESDADTDAADEAPDPAQSGDAAEVESPLTPAPAPKPAASGRNAPTGSPGGSEGYQRIGDDIDWGERSTPEQERASRAVRQQAEQAHSSEVVNQMKFGTADPRLRFEFMDWLQESDNEVDRVRGELLYLRMQGESEGATQNDRIRVDDQINALREKHLEALLGPWANTDAAPHFGFTHGPYLSGSVWPSDVEQVLEDHGLGALDWVYRLDFSGDKANETVDLVLASYYRRQAEHLVGWLSRIPVLGFVRGAEGGQFDTDLTRPLVFAQQMNGLRELWFSQSGVGSDGLANLLWGLRNDRLPRLEVLSLYQEGLGDEDAHRLLLPDMTHQFRILDLSGNYFSHGVVQALREKFGSRLRLGD